MCGVAGFWLRREGDPTQAEWLLTKLADTMQHRGPDGAGVWFDRRTGVGLAHRRLSILDLSDTGHQPMRSHNGRYVLSFNGEIYNFRELRRELERDAPRPWKGSSDTEVLLTAIETWGLSSALERCIGMFAFALWDRQDRVLQLVRDRFGVKPLSFGVSPEGLCFGSELRALRYFPGFDRSIDPEALSAYIERSYVPTPLSIYRDARKVPPGCILRFSGPSLEDVTEQRWWSATGTVRAARAQPFQGTFEDATDALEALLTDSIRLRMISDVPLGAFLSGGIDSSTVVSLMQAHSAVPVHTFSIGSPSTQFDESSDAAAVARHLGTNHTPLVVTPKMALDTIPVISGIHDEPFADSSQLPTYLVARLAKGTVTVALSGDGGDELFGGYNRHVWTPRIWAAVRHIPTPLRGGVARAIQRVPPSQWDALFRPLGRFSPSSQPGSHLHKLASILSSSDLAQMYATLVRQWSAASILNRPTAHTSVGALEDASGGPEPLMLEDLRTYLPDDILTKVDRASMAVSLEAREPLLDHRLLAFSWSLPTEYKVSGSTGKQVLRQVLGRHVPRTLTNRPKMGFGIPLGDWLRADLRDWAWELLRPEALRADGLFRVEAVQHFWDEHQSGQRSWAHGLWSILMFQSWRQGEAS